MSDKFSAKNSLRAKGRALAGQTEELKAQFAQLAEGADRILGQHERRLSAVEETILAVVQTVGLEAIQEAIAEQRKVNGEKRVADEKAMLDEAVADGYVVPVETVDETSFVVGVELDKDGNLLAYGAQQCAFLQLPEPFKALLLGKKLGDVVETLTAGKFELTGVYRIDEVKRAEVMKAKEEAAKAAASAPPAPAAEETA